MMEITFNLNEKTIRFLEKEAGRRGVAPAQIIEALAESQRKTRGELAIERMQGTATNGLTADEIMAETRSEEFTLTEPDTDPGRVDEWLGRITGTLKTSHTTDEIMDQTRSEV